VIGSDCLVDKSSAVSETVVFAGSYVGQALAQGHMEGEITEKTEEWPQVEQGCRLGNYQRTSVRCRAAELAVDGWDDTKPIPLDDVAKFCDANYLEQSLALCLVTHGGVTVPRVPRSSSEYLIRLLMAFQRLMFFRNCAATGGTQVEGRTAKRNRGLGLRRFARGASTLPRRRSARPAQS
jgi:hypothetical protein